MIVFGPPLRLRVVNRTRDARSLHKNPITKGDPTMKTKSNLKAGGFRWNHNQTVKRAAE